MTGRILLVTGAKHIGVDNLHRLLTANNSLLFSANNNSYAWAIYKHPDSSARFPKFDELKHVILGKLDSVVQFRPRNNLDIELHDPDYRIKLAAKQLQSQDNYMFTNWRSPDEHKYLVRCYNNIVTTRIFSSGAHSSTDSLLGHGLSNWNTEYLIVPNNQDEWEFRQAVKNFSFYQHYVLCDHL